VSRFRRRAILAIGIALIGAVPAIGVGRAAVVPPSPSPYPGCAQVGVTGGEWRTYGHDLSNTRTQDREKVIGPATVGGLTKAWEHQSTGAYNNTPVIADGCMYLAASDGSVTAHDADTGAVLWERKLPIERAAFGGGIVGSPAVDAQHLYVFVNDEGKPYIRALHRTDGSDAWHAVIDTQPLSMSNASPVLFNGMILAGFAGHAGGGQLERGGFVILDAATGDQLKKTFVIPDDRFAQGYAGAGIWSTSAVDTATGYAYAGTSNPHNAQFEDPRANSILKIDVDPARATFGEIVDSYKGLPDTYVDGADRQPACDTAPDALLIPGFGFSATCLRLDLDFGASPTLYENGGRQLVGDLQKAGVFHAVDRGSMDKVWSTPVGVPCLACNAASPASAGGHVFTAAGPPGQMFGLDGGSGLPRWAGLLNGVTTYNAVSAANGLVYSVDGGGFLNVWDERNGVQLLKRNMALDTGRFMGHYSTSSGIAIARNTVYAAVLDTVVAYRLGALGVPSVPGVPQVPGVPGGSGGQVIAGPGAVATTYATPAVTIQQGQSLAFTNLDVAQHDVDARDGTSFESPLVGLGGTTPVNGVESLAPGSYEFYCSLHANMTGTLTVQ
jgi:polyvinyl alcohol dehydrogenase (cytochrome)